MTPDERAKWCLQQAEEASRGVPPADDDAPRTMAQIAPDWWRLMAFRVAEQNGSGHA